MSTLLDLADLQEAVALDQHAPDCMFDPGSHFGEWLESLEGFRNREQAGSRPVVYLEAGDYDFAEALSLDDQLPDSAYYKGTLVVTEYEEMQAEVEVTVAVIDGIFKGKIKATENVFLENHALVIGEINTPALTIQGGAIIEGRCYFDPFEQVVAPLERLERPGWQTFKIGFARVWRRRISQ